jgi:ubiquitin-like protein Pup
MAEQEQRRKNITGEDQGSETTSAARTSGNSEKLKDDMDALLDEIDTVLEENADEFVRSYVQKGGE